MGVLGVLVKKGVVLGVLELFVGICTTLVLCGVKRLFISVLFCFKWRKGVFV